MANGSHNAADQWSSRYSPLDQIDASNFNDLELAWTFKTDNLAASPEYKLEGTPLMIGGVLYTTAGTRPSARAVSQVLVMLLDDPSLASRRRPLAIAASFLQRNRVFHRTSDA